MIMSNKKTKGFGGTIIIDYRQGVNKKVRTLFINDSWVITTISNL